MPTVISRRECLQTGLAAALGSHSFAAPKTPAITFGFSLYGMRSLA